jgi:hypothetical protein
VFLRFSEIAGPDKASVQAASQNQQARVLAGVERIRRAGAWPPPKAERLVMVASTHVIAGPNTAVGWFRLRHVHNYLPPKGGPELGPPYLMLMMLCYTCIFIKPGFRPCGSPTPR